jgi:mRNA-degrading endonuclease RelE of RelBE toxin-antitoxin system
LTVDWTPRALKEAKRLDTKVRERVVEAIDGYAETGVGDVKPLKGSLEGQLRLKVGKWRVLFLLEEEAGVMSILHVLPRDRAYRVREPAEKFGHVAVGVTALAVAFDGDSMEVALSDARRISIPLTWYPRLLDADPVQRENWELIEDGEGIHWPDVDEDLNVRGFLRGARAPGAKA